MYRDHNEPYSSIYKTIYERPLIDETPVGRSFDETPVSEKVDEMSASPSVDETPVRRPRQSTRRQICGHISRRDARQTAASVDETPDRRPRQPVTRPRQLTRRRTDDRVSRCK